jgi:hypothetical protein
MFRLVILEIGPKVLAERVFGRDIALQDVT